MIDQNVILIAGVIILGAWALFKLQKNFNERLFFKIGLWLFLIQAFANTWGLFIDFNILPAWALIVRVGSTLFNYLIAYFFYYLMSKAPASMGGAGTTLTPEEISEFMKEDFKPNDETQRKNKKNIKGKPSK